MGRFVRSDRRQALLFISILIATVLIAAPIAPASGAEQSGSFQITGNASCATPGRVRLPAPAGACEYVRVTYDADGVTQTRTGRIESPIGTFEDNYVVDGLELPRFPLSRWYSVEVGSYGTGTFASAPVECRTRVLIAWYQGAVYAMPDVYGFNWKKGVPPPCGKPA